MDLYKEIIKVYPELTDHDFIDDGTIRLYDDGDGVQYIGKWDYTKPIPLGLKLGK
jgi:hypothetical protein